LLVASVPSALFQTAVERLCSKSQYSSLPCYLAGDSFTLPQLQGIYEILLGDGLHKANFRKKILDMAILEALDGQLEAKGAHRPAQFYRLKPELREQLTLLARGI
jgi:8-oxo-dGTP diphosphatase